MVPAAHIAPCCVGFAPLPFILISIAEISENSFGLRTEK